MLAMNPQLLAQPIFQVTLPLMITFVGAIWIAQWSQNRHLDTLNKRIDDLKDSINKRLDGIDKRLDSIEATLKNYGDRILTLEERTSPLVRR